MEDSLLTRPDVFQAYFGHHPDAVYLVNINGQIVDVNASAVHMFGYTREELLGTTIDEWSSQVDIDIRSVRHDVQPGVPFHEATAGCTEVAVRHKTGRTVYTRLTSAPLESADRTVGTLITAQDITHQRDERKELLEIQEMFSFISRQSQNIISSFSKNGVFTYVSPNVKTLLGYMPQEVIGQPQTFFNHPDDNQELLKFRDPLSAQHDTARFTGRVRHKNGDYRWYETTVQYVRDETGEIVQVVGVGRDITDRKEAEQTISHMAYHDALTQLPNRRLFQERISHVLSESTHELHGLLLLDLDGFKTVNDTFGHHIGDAVLIEVANRLAQVVSGTGIVARWGGDEFAVLLTNLASREDVARLTERIETTISQPIVVDSLTLSVRASIGAAFFPTDGDTVQALMRIADIAMYEAKNIGAFETDR